MSRLCGASHAAVVEGSLLSRPIACSAAGDRRAIMKSDIGYKNPNARQFANDLLAGKSFERGDARAFHMPVEVYVQVASACNLDCYMCYEHLRPEKFKRGRGLRVLGPELFAKLEREVLPHSLKITFGVGGEPMLCEHLLDYIERSYALNLHVHLMTNGTRITTDKTAERLARCLSSMEVSIDAATKETYERIRIGSKWEKLLSNFERLNRFRDRYPESERTHLSLCFVMMQSNVHELPAFVELGRKLGADRVAAWHVIPVTPDGKKESLQYDKEKSDHFLRLAHLKARDIGIEADLVRPFDPKLEEELAPLIAESRQGAIARKEARERERSAGESRAREKSADEWLEDEDAWSRPLTGKHAHEPSVSGGALFVERGASNGATPSNGGASNGTRSNNGGTNNGATLHNGGAGNGAAHHGGAEHNSRGSEAAEDEPWKGTTIEEGLAIVPGDVDPSTGVRLGAAWQPMADPPPHEDAARALAEFEARPKAARLHCHMPTMTAFIFFDGRVFPCCHPHAHTKLPMGDLRRQSFREIWNGRAYRNLRAGLRLGDPPPLCQRCSIMQSPPPVFEDEDELEGQAADLASYYGALDLEPRAEHESSNSWDLEREAMFEQLAESKKRIDAVEHENRGMKAHIAAIESQRAGLALHAKNLDYLVKSTGAERIHALRTWLKFWKR
jgi:MoaA/NifB/PqqE/SkfB family radical SAM enzyme